MKKIINKPEDIVRQMCHGIVTAHPDLLLEAEAKIIYRKHKNMNKVNLISGGGSGHEPAHAGFVGPGMLDAAVCGDVFASPSQIQVYKAVRLMQTPSGVLLIIKNYSGDVMNFMNAAKLASDDGILVDYVIVDDDIAVKDSLYTVGRRGVAGTVLVHKIAGAAAESGKSLSEVKAAAQKAVKNVKSIGLALTSCTVPSKGEPMFDLGAKEMEYGVGIHGEPGIRRTEVVDAHSLARKMTGALCEELGIGSKQEDKRVAVLINGFGATPLMELYLLNASVARELAQRNITVARTFVGNYMTSLDMAGASVSIMALDDELEALLSMPSETPAFTVLGAKPDCGFYEPYDETDVETRDGGEPLAAEGAEIRGDFTLKNMQYVIDSMGVSIIRNEQAFCGLDAHAGDGDFGTSVANGFRKLRKEWARLVGGADEIGAFLSDCSLIIMEHCGGASGPIWGSAFRAAGKAAASKKSLSVGEFAGLLRAAVLSIRETGERSFGRGAVVGDKTLIDALDPAADAWEECAKTDKDFLTAFKVGAKAAAEGAERTKEMVARMGRAGNVGERSLGYPDAGAHALGVIFSEIASGLK